MGELYTIKSEGKFTQSFNGRAFDIPKAKDYNDPCSQVDAGWSSLEARRAHNPKVIGSNPVPATNERA